MNVVETVPNAVLDQIVLASETPVRCQVPLVVGFS